MQSRITIASAVAVLVPIVVVLIAVVVLARASSQAPAMSSGEAPVANGMPAAPASQVPAMAKEMPAVSASQVPAMSSGEAPVANEMPAPMPTPKPRPSGPAAPGFDGAGDWINSEPLTLAELGASGKVVLVDFWTFGCYNCRNTLPYVKQWWDKYKDQGLVIVGVHTPEFDSERVLANVQEAVQREGIGWPVVQDNDYAIWQAYGNHYWPRFYLVDERGQIIYDHIGEGAYEETEAQIVAALAARGQ